MRIFEDALDGDGYAEDSHLDDAILEKGEVVPVSKRNVSVKLHVWGICDQKLPRKITEQTCHFSLQDGHLRTYKHASLDHKIRLCNFFTDVKISRNCLFKK